MERLGGIGWPEDFEDCDEMDWGPVMIAKRKRRVEKSGEARKDGERFARGQQVTIDCRFCKRRRRGGSRRVCVWRRVVWSVE